MKIWVLLLQLLLSTFALAQDRQGITKIELLTYTWQELRGFCGMDGGIEIILSNPNGQTCSTTQSGGFSGGDKLTWGSNSLLSLESCGNFPINTNTMVYFQSYSNDDFCPNRVSIFKSNGQRFESKMEDQRYNNADNQMGHPVALKGISRIFMTMAKCENHHDSKCGGNNIKLKIQTGRFHCTVATKPTVSAGELVVWGKNEIGNCGPVPINEETNVWVKTDAFNDQFIPFDLEIYMDDYINTNWRVRLGGKRFNIFVNNAQKNTNNNRLGVVKTWPRDNYITPVRDRPLTCPENEAESCPAADMYAYRLRSTMRMNCIFECPLINSTPFSASLDLTDGTGHRCLSIGEASKQYDWCCRTKATSGGIPLCSEVIDHRRVETVVENIPSTHSDCPNQGCPIVNVVGRLDVGTTSQLCEPGCDNIYDMSNFDCITLGRQMRKKKYCCNDPNAITALPQCSSVNNPGSSSTPTGTDGRTDDPNSQCTSIVQNQNHPRNAECRQYLQNLLNTGDTEY